jgi:hypothetical protein
MGSTTVVVLKKRQQNDPTLGKSCGSLWPGRRSRKASEIVKTKSHGALGGLISNIPHPQVE